MSKYNFYNNFQKFFATIIHFVEFELYSQKQVHTL